MKLRLSIVKREELSYYSGTHYIRFAVVDLDRSREYPGNFVCILPKQIKPNGKLHSNFERQFGDASLEVANKLLKKALRAERDIEVKEEIRERLKLLKQKPQRNTRKNRA